VILKRRVPAEEYSATRGFAPQEATQSPPGSFFALPQHAAEAIAASVICSTRVAVPASASIR
jgi:hypothetical protein